MEVAGLLFFCKGSYALLAVLRDGYQCHFLFISAHIYIFNMKKILLSVQNPRKRKHNKCLNILNLDTFKKYA